MTRPSGARWSSPGTISAIQVRSVTSSTAPSRFDAVSSGPNIRKLSRVAGHHVAQHTCPSTRVASARGRAGRRDVHGVVAEVGQREVAQELAAVGDRVGAHPPGAGRAPARPAPGGACRRRRTAPRAGRSASSPRGSRGSRRSCGPRSSAPGGCASCPRPGLPSISLGPVQPFGVRSTIIGQRGRSVTPSSRARRWISRISSSDRVQGRGELLVDVGGIVALDVVGRVAVALHQRRQLLGAGSGRAPSGWRSCSR